MTLTAARVKEIRHSGKRYPNGTLRNERHYDRDGLYLQVKPPTRTSPHGAKQWLQRIMIAGRRSDYGLGPYPYVGLREAREAAFENQKAVRAYRKALARGESPPVPVIVANRAATLAMRNGEAAPEMAVARPGTTFEQAFEACIRHRAPAWKESVREASKRSWRANLRDYLHCVAKRPAATLTTADLQRCLAPVIEGQPKTAAKVLRRVGTCFEHVIGVLGLRTDNPARALARSLPRSLNGKTAHYKALAHAEVAGVLARIEASNAKAALKGAIRLQALTALRPTEARLARWEEVDLDRALWTIPASRMKECPGEVHRIPLPRQAIEVLEAAGPRKAGLVFEGRAGQPVSESAARKLFARLGIDANPHGFRSSFRDWAAEAGWPREAAERALAHSVSGGGVEAAYLRSDLLDQRRALMQAYADHVAP